MYSLFASRNKDLLNKVSINYINIIFAEKRLLRVSQNFLKQRIEEEKEGKGGARSHEASFGSRLPISDHSI
jgi:hypothetical protein